MTELELLRERVDTLTRGAQRMRCHAHTMDASNGWGCPVCVFTLRMEVAELKRLGGQQGGGVGPYPSGSRHGSRNPAAAHATESAPPLVPAYDADDLLVMARRLAWHCVHSTGVGYHDAAAGEDLRRAVEDARAMGLLPIE